MLLEWLCLRSSWWWTTRIAWQMFLWFETLSVTLCLGSILGQLLCCFYSESRFIFLWWRDLNTALKSWGWVFASCRIECISIPQNLILHLLSDTTARTCLALCRFVRNALFNELMTVLSIVRPPFLDERFTIRQDRVDARFILLLGISRLGTMMVRCGHWSVSWTHSFSHFVFWSFALLA